jgi:hypothetical protein
MPESIVDVDLAVLKGMVQKLIDLEVDSRCHIAAANRLFAQDQPMRSRLAVECDRAVPEAGDAIYLRYRALINALEIGTDVRSELAKFALQEGWRTHTRG